MNNYCKKYTTTPQPDFSLVPSDECIRTMERLDFICRYTDEKGGLIILSRILGKNLAGEDLLRFLPAAGDKLSFWLILKSPAVFNFNELPVSIDPASIFYFSNQLIDGAALRNNLHISSNAVGVDSSVDIRMRKNTSYTFHHGANVSPGAAVVKHELTGVELEPYSIINQPGSSDLYFNLSGLPQGNCNLFINHIDKDQFYFTGEGDVRQVFGVIELSLSPALEANYRIVESDKSITAARPLYVIPFINRSTKWRYTLELTENSPLYQEWNALPAPDKTDFKNRLNIISNDSAIVFTQTLADPNGKSYQFISSAPLKLKEKYVSSSSSTHDVLGLTLKKYIGNAAKEASVRTDLPCPTTGLIDAHDSTIYSDILLTI